MKTDNREKNVATKGQRPTILVSSSVYGIEELLDRIYTVLTTFGYQLTRTGRRWLQAHPQEGNR